MKFNQLSDWMEAKVMAIFILFASIAVDIPPLHTRMIFFIAFSFHPFVVIARVFRTSTSTSTAFFAYWFKLSK